MSTGTASGRRGFDAEFDFLDHELILRTTDGQSRSIALQPRTVADFYATTMDALAALSLPCTIVAAPNEVSPAVPFATDTEHKEYDAASATTYWRQLVASDRVFQQWRAAESPRHGPGRRHRRVPPG